DEIGQEDQAAGEDADDRERLTGISVGDLGGHVVHAPPNLLFVDEDAHEPLRGEESLKGTRGDDASVLRARSERTVTGPRAQYPVPSTQYPVPSTQYSVLSTQYPVPSTEYWVLGTGYWELG